LQDADMDVRRQAAVALGEIGDPRAVELLINTLQDSDNVVRILAASALRRIGTPEALEAVRKWRGTP
jgi:HEAT repeat protein